MSVMLLQGLKYSPQKSRPLESGHRRHGVCIAIECSYKLDQKNEFKFLCELCTFSQIRSHIISYFSESGIWLGKILVDDVQFAKFAKVFPHQNFALYGIMFTLQMNNQLRMVLRRKKLMICNHSYAILWQSKCKNSIL